MISVAWVANAQLSLQGRYPILFQQFRGFLLSAAVGKRRTVASAIPGGRHRRNGWLKGCYLALLGGLLFAVLPARASGFSMSS